ncbi:MAG: DUF5397 family protein [Hyphomicrobiaceae bacterium]|nr:DUF5397 family protein [Hyphomicrobiaceae bacterium]
MNVTVSADRNIVIPLDDLVGTFRSFGPAGPTYEVLNVIEPATGSNILLQVRVVESRELLDYPLAQAMLDPLAL